MERPTEFRPVYDQTQKQAAELVEKLFQENEELRADADRLRKEYETVAADSHEIRFSEKRK